MTRAISVAALWFAASLGFTTLAPLADAADKVTVAMNTDTVGSTGPHYIAKDKGYFAAEGLDVVFAKSDSPTSVTATALSGGADLGTAGLNAGFYNVAGNGDLKVIAASSYELPGYHGQVFVASTAAYNNGVHTLADLAGKKIGYSVGGTGLQLAVIAAGQKYHFPVNATNSVALNTTGNMAAALRAGTIAAADMPGLAGLALAAAGDAKVIGWIGDEVPYLSSMVFATRRTLDNRRDVLVRYMRAYLKAAVEYDQVFQKSRDAQGNFRNDAHAQELLGIMAKNTNQPIDVMIKSIPYIAPDGAVDIAEVQRQMDIWKQLGMYGGGDAKNLIDLTILADAGKAAH